MSNKLSKDNMNKDNKVINDLTKVILPEEVDKDCYEKVVSYLSAIGFFKGKVLLDYKETITILLSIAKTFNIDKKINGAGLTFEQEVLALLNQKEKHGK